MAHRLADNYNESSPRTEDVTVELAKQAEKKQVTMRLRQCFTPKNIALLTSEPGLISLITDNYLRVIIGMAKYKEVRNSLLPPTTAATTPVCKNFRIARAHGFYANGAVLDKIRDRAKRVYNQLGFPTSKSDTKVKGVMSHTAYSLLEPAELSLYKHIKSIDVSSPSVFADKDAMMLYVFQFVYALGSLQQRSTCSLQHLNISLKTLMLSLPRKDTTETFKYTYPVITNAADGAVESRDAYISFHRGQLYNELRKATTCTYFALVDGYVERSVLHSSAPPIKPPEFAAPEQSREPCKFSVSEFSSTNALAPTQLIERNIRERHNMFYRAHKHESLAPYDGFRAPCAYIAFKTRVNTGAWNKPPSKYVMYPWRADMFSFGLVLLEMVVAGRAVKYVDPKTMSGVPYAPRAFKSESSLGSDYMVESLLFVPRAKLNTADQDAYNKFLDMFKKEDARADMPQNDLFAHVFLNMCSLISAVQLHGTTSSGQSSPTVLPAMADFVVSNLSADDMPDVPLVAHMVKNAKSLRSLVRNYNVSSSEPTVSFFTHILDVAAKEYGTEFVQLLKTLLTWNLVQETKGFYELLSSAYLSKLPVPASIPGTAIEFRAPTEDRNIPSLEDISGVYHKVMDNGQYATYHERCMSMFRDSTTRESMLKKLMTEPPAPFNMSPLAAEDKITTNLAAVETALYNSYIDNKQ